MHFAPKGKQRELLEISPSTSSLEEEKAAEAEVAQDPSNSNSVHHILGHKANPVPNASVEAPCHAKKLRLTLPES